jgi:hypothetical protein
MSMVGVVRMQFDESELRHALDEQARRQRTGCANAADVRRLEIFFVQPEFLEHFVELIVVAELRASAG